MSDLSQPHKAQDHSWRPLIVSVICIPVIAWLFYNAYQKYQQSGVQTTACENKCTQAGYAGYEFKWPMFSPPQCTCLSSRQ
ncbi:MAG: hypothetical protein KGI24_03430 [Candidatus Omnitrophica bacterium]|nr:hypothetical protein [Candidatus Omnitrophota bacterium]MDE2213631.1 hypothetical protein [Candidatus Omnitrophota bacterium]MDE2230468.1 hypothetical protein [Candidatus Omnitrophota bacterium]